MHILTSLTGGAWSVASQQVVQVDQVLVLSQEVFRCFAGNIGGVGGGGGHGVGRRQQLKNMGTLKN